MSDPTPHSAPLARCSHCGREGTLTSLSAGNTCEDQDGCEAARLDTIARAEAIEQGAKYDHLPPRQAARAMRDDLDNGVLR